MKVQEWEVRRARFSLKEENVYILQGDWPSGYEMVVFLDKEKIPARREAWEYESALEVFGKPETLKGEKITVFLTLPENWENCRHLGVFALNGEEKLLWYEASVKRLKEARRTPQFYLEEELVDGKNGNLYLRGWAADREQVKIGLFDQEKKKLDYKIRRSDRLDVQEKLRFYHRGGGRFRKAGLSGALRFRRKTDLSGQPESCPDSEA